MGTCLVTTLKESVTDTDLLKLGDFTFVINDTEITKLYAATDNVSNFVNITVRGDGYITNETGTSNLGKTASRNNDNNPIYFSPGKYQVVISNKYKLNKLDFRRGPAYNTYGIPIIDISDFSGMNILLYLRVEADNITGDLATLSILPALRQLRFSNLRYNSKLKGQFRPASILLESIHINGCKDALVDLSDLQNKVNCTTLFLTGSKSKGNVSNVSSMSNLRELYCGDTQVEGNVNTLPSSLVGISLSTTNVVGNLSAFSQMTGLISLNVSNTSISGDTSDLAGLTDLTTFTYANCPNITGTWPLT